MHTSLLKIDTLKLVYFAYFHSILSYGVIFWENSSDGKRVFNTQNKIIRLMAGVKGRVSYRELFLSLASEFLVSLPLSLWTTWRSFQILTYIV
jgi:hypothetical protein